MSHSPEKKSDLIADRQALLDLMFQEEELGTLPPKKFRGGSRQNLCSSPLLSRGYGSSTSGNLAAQLTISARPYA